MLEHLERFQSSPHAGVLALHFWNASKGISNPEDFLGKAITDVARILDSPASVSRADRGRWRVVAEAGDNAQAPQTLLAEVLDEGRPAESEGWSAAPLADRAENGLILAVQLTNLQEVADAAGLLGISFEQAKIQTGETRKLRRSRSHS